MKKILLFAAAALISSGAFAAEKVLAEVDFSSMSSYTLWHQPEDGPAEFGIKDGALEVYNDKVATNFWDVQYVVADKLSVKAGTEYTISIKIKGFSGTLHTNLSAWNEDATYGGIDVEAKDGWQTVTTTMVGATTTSEAHLILQSGDFVGTFYIESVKITYNDEGGETPDVPVVGGPSLITGGKASEGETASIQAGWSGPAKVVANPEGEGVVFEAPISANDDIKQPWNTQLFIIFNEALEEGAKIRVAFDYYCSDSRTIELQAQGNPGTYHYYKFIPALNAKPSWQSVNTTVDITNDYVTDGDGKDDGQGCKTIAFNLASAAEAATFYINNVVVEKLEGTAVESVAIVAAPAGVYNLNGVKVADELNSNLPKGIYIVGGKKVVR